MAKKLCLTFILFILFFASAFSQDNPLQAVTEYRKAHEAEILQDYRTLLEIPNVASDIDNIHRNAKWIMDAFEERGARMELLTLPDQPEAPPVIYGEIKTPGVERTLIIYAHYDGQPADPKNWTHQPWEPILYSAAMEEGGQPIEFPTAGEPVNPEWRIYGRSSSDDKVPHPAILAALDGLQESGIPLTSNLTFLMVKKRTGHRMFARFSSDIRINLTVISGFFLMVRNIRVVVRRWCLVYVDSQGWK